MTKFTLVSFIFYFDGFIYAFQRNGDRQVLKYRMLFGTLSLFWLIILIEIYSERRYVCVVFVHAVNTKLYQRESWQIKTQILYIIRVAFDQLSIMETILISLMYNIKRWATITDINFTT